MDFSLAQADLLHLEKTLWVLTVPTGITNYDFRFDSFFPCQRTWEPPSPLCAVARIGPFPSYEAVYQGLQEDGIFLINTPEEHFRASELPGWYPLIAGLTPKSLWFKEHPDPELLTVAQVMLNFFDFFSKEVF